MTKKHVIGATWQTSLEGHAIFACSRNVGYSPLVNVEDRTDREAPSMEAMKYGFHLTYDKGQTGYRDIRMTFLDGSFTDTKVFLPSRKRAYSDGDLTVAVNDEGSGFLSVLYQVGEHSGSSSASVPSMDPYRVFGIHGSLLSMSFGFTFQPHFLGPQDQMLLLFSEASGRSPEEVISDAWEDDGHPVAHGFSWTSGLEPLPPGTVRTFDVCMEEGSLDWYVDTGTDVYGEWIGEEYINGEFPALFRSAGCQTDYADMLRTSVSHTVPTVEEEVVDVTVTVTQVSSNPIIPYRILRDAHALSLIPSKTPISDMSFTFALEDSAGLIEVVTSVTDTYTFRDVPLGRWYKVTVIETATGAVTYSYLTAQRAFDPTKVPTTVPLGTISTTGKVTGTTLAGTPTVTDPTTKDCLCGIEGSINFNSGEPTGTDPCGICWSCGTDGLLYRAGTLSGQMVRDLGSPVTYATSQGGTDGQISFNGGLAPVPTSVSPYMPTTFTLDLYQVQAQGEVPTGSPSQSVVNTLSLSNVFTGLSMGWWCIEISAVHSDCVSRYWYYLGETFSRENCPFRMDVHVEPCFNLLTAEVTLPDPTLLGSVTFAVNGNPTVFLPVMVQPGDIFSVSVSFLDGCKSVQTYSVTAADLQCDQLPTYPTGCTDPTAINFDPAATIDSGRCIYGVVGCMDPEASNFNQYAVYPGTCLYMCDDPVISSVDIVSGYATINFVQEQLNYTVLWQDLLGGTSETIEDFSSYQVGTDVYLVTVTTSLGCVQQILVSSSEIRVGCMDTLATNYTPSANIPYDYLFLGGTQVSGPCTYSLPDSPCVPRDIIDALSRLDTCIASKATKWYDRMRAGMNSTCFTKEFQTLVLLRYLLHQHGLRCVFNCADPATPTQASVTGPSCAELWAKGGPSGQSLVFQENERENPVEYVYGDVVQFEDAIWTWTLTQPSDGSPQESPLQGWKLCTDAEPYTDTVDRLSQYMSFINDACRDCWTTVQPTTTTPTPDVDTDGGQPITDGGQPIILT